MSRSTTMVSPCVIMIGLCYAVCGISALPITSEPVSATGIKNVALSSSDDNSLLAQVGSLEFPYDPSCAQTNGFLFSAGDVSCMATPFKPIAYCDNRSDLVACIRKSLGGASSMKYLKVDSQASRSQFESMAMSAEGGGWGVKVSASAEATRESKMSTQSTSYVLYGHKHFSNFEVANPHLLELTDDAKHLIDQGFEEFTRTYGTHMVGYITSGATYLGSYTFFSTTSSTDEVTKISASVDVAGGLFSAGASGGFDHQQSSMNADTRTDATVKCTGSAICTMAVPDTPNKILEMSKAWHNDTKLEGKPLKMVIYPFARATSFANAVRNASGKSWLPAEVDAMFGFGLPTKPMLTEWKLQQAEAESFRKAVSLALSTWQGVANPTDQVSRADKDSIDKRSNRTLGKLPSLCTCPSGRRYEVADYEELNTCNPDNADWEFEWWLKGGAVACSGGVVRWNVSSDRLCDATRKTSLDPRVKLSEATMSATCGVPEIRLQLLRLQTRVEAYYSQFLNTSLAHVLTVQRAWQMKRSEVFFYDGLTLQELKDQLEAIARLMDSTLILLEGLSMNTDCHVEATFTSHQMQAITVDMEYNDDNDTDVQHRMRTPQACAVAVMTEAKKDPLKCSRQFFRFQAAVDDKEAVCECFPPSTKCTKALTHHHDYVQTFKATGCCQERLNATWWQTQPKKEVLGDMYEYCSLAKIGKAQQWQKDLCGCEEAPTTCTLQTGFVETYDYAYDYGQTFKATGCCQERPDATWWKTQPKETVLEDMHRYCTAVKEDKAKGWQRDLCGCEEAPTTCTLQTEFKRDARKNIPHVGEVMLTPNPEGYNNSSSTNTFIFRINTNNPTGKLSM